MSLNIFDTYNLRARVCVSIFYAAPFIFDILCLSHETFSIAEGIILSAVCVTVCQAVYIARLLKSGLPKIQLPSFSPPRQLCHQGLVLATIASWHRWNLSFNHCCRASIQILRVNLAMLIDYVPMLFLGYGPKRVSQQHFGWYMRRTSIMGTSGTCYD